MSAATWLIERVTWSDLLAVKEYTKIATVAAIIRKGKYEDRFCAFKDYSIESLLKSQLSFNLIMQVEL